MGMFRVTGSIADSANTQDDTMKKNKLNKISATLQTSPGKQFTQPAQKKWAYLHHRHMMQQNFCICIQVTQL